MSYIPKREADKVLWLANFTTWVSAHGTSRGLSPQEVAELVTATADADSAVADNETAQAAAKGTTALKNDKLGAAIAMSRDFGQRLQLDPNMTDQDRADAGLTQRDHQSTAHDPDHIYTVTPPDVEPDWSIRQQVTLHWGPNPQDERHNGRPEGVIACEIQYHIGGIPENEEDWKTLDTDTDSPFIHHLETSQPVTIAYRARYIGKAVKFGPFSAPVTCTVTV